ncbi:MAG: SDR family NAD(P)-dependent oxidoreductase [Actinomycetota bacterium]|nr:SDR family NAD(P)-dependent oxidoreductase [Actinomycetota bacterium]
MGAAIAGRLAEEGAAVAVTARTLEAHPTLFGTLDDRPTLPGTLNDVVASLKAHGSKAVAIRADLTDDDARARIVPAVEATLGPVDILINNAAAAFYAPTADLNLRRRRLLFELNVHALVDLAQDVIPSMRAQGRGWIVNISSATSRHPKGPPFDPGIKLGARSTLYGATKAALERITTGLAAEVYDDGIAVNSLAPVAAVRTPGAEAHLGTLLDDRPEIVEPIDLIVEAAVVLATCDPATVTGRVVYSRPFLRELGRSV